MGFTVVALLGTLIPVVGTILFVQAFSRASTTARPVFIAIAALLGGYLGLVDSLWAHRSSGLIFVVTVFLILAIVAAALARDGKRARGGVTLLLILWLAHVLVSVVAGARGDR